jgi:hypothetical protein
MKQPPTYDAVHPIWIRGREWGIAEERQRIIERLQYVMESYKGFDSTEPGREFDSGVRQALTVLIQELSFADEL